MRALYFLLFLSNLLNVCQALILPAKDFPKSINAEKYHCFSNLKRAVTYNELAQEDSPDYIDDIKRAIAEAKQIANHAARAQPDGQFSDVIFDYFMRCEDNADPDIDFSEDFDLFKNMMNEIKDFEKYDIEMDINWSDTDNACITENLRNGKIKMTFGRPFFQQEGDGPRTVQSIINGRKDPRRRIDDYQTGGHTIIHELTHINALARAAELHPVRPGEYLTQDYEILNNPNYPSSARRLKTLIKGYSANQLERLERGPFERYDVILPRRNAESYAAAATDYYFRSVFKFENKIPS